MIRQIRNDPNHPLRLKFAEFINQFGEKLQSGDSAAVAAVNALKEPVTQNADWTGLIRQTLVWVKDTVRQEATSANPGLRLLDYDALAQTVSSMLGQISRSS
jgi:uncharacterized membrane-anchored protein YjiN (DUF445 family)